MFWRFGLCDSAARFCSVLQLDFRLFCSEDSFSGEILQEHLLVSESMPDEKMSPERESIKVRDGFVQWQ